MQERMEGRQGRKIYGKVKERKKEMKYFFCSHPIEIVLIEEISLYPVANWNKRVSNQFPN